MFKKLICPLFLMMVCCAASQAQNSHIHNYGTAAALSPTLSATTCSVNRVTKEIQKENARQARKFRQNLEAAEKKSTHLQAQVNSFCGQKTETVCSECGRTANETAVYGHHHKPPYVFVRSEKAENGKAQAPEAKAGSVKPENNQTRQCVQGGEKNIKKTQLASASKGKDTEKSAAQPITSNSEEARKPYF